MKRSMKLNNPANSLGEKAVRHFRDDGYNCSQSVLLTMAEHWKCKNELIPKVATAFGGGMGRCGSVCGALTGGLIAIGLKYGTNEPSVKKRSRAYELGETLYRRFEKQNGTVMCRELIGLDLSDAEQREKAHEEHVFEKNCNVFVKSAVEILAALDRDTI
ncbi:MAG TPA: C-GCAxxG-C-C family protein [candidate division Zixibacteria bacterium]|nr:C-GCAxxG-C-C family protein [candidate division Zixibacteria bacterium]